MVNGMGLSPGEIETEENSKFPEGKGGESERKASTLPKGGGIPFNPSLIKKSAAGKEGGDQASDRRKKCSSRF